MTTRSSTRNLYPPLKNPEHTIRRRTHVDPSLLNNFKEINMATNGNGDDGPPVGGVQNSCQFYGLPGDDANKHLDKFLHVTQSIKVNGVSDDALCLYLFPHSLTHHATAWFDRLSRNSITTFEQMAKMFLEKYFPPSMVTKLRNEITNFRQRLDESLFEAWEHNMLSINHCPNQNMLPITQIDTFYNGLTLRHRDTINAATGGTFMKRQPEECYDLIENMTAHHNNWDTSAQRSESSIYITSSFDLEIVALKAEMAKINKNLIKVLQTNQQVKVVTSSCETCGGPHSYRECQAIDGHIQMYMLREPTIKVVILTNLKFATMFKSLLNNKEKLFDLATTPMNENCLAIIQKKLPEKPGDLGKFLITCDFLELVECLSLADLGASINLMPPSIWEKLSLPELTPTQIILKLADRSTTRPADIAEDIFVKVGKFHFSIDFVVVDYVIDPRVPLILERPFLRIGRALIDVYGEELTLQVAFLNDDPSLPPPNQGNYLPQVRNELKICEAKSDKSSIDEPLEVELKDLPPHIEYAFLKGADKLPVIIAKDLSVEEKTALIAVLKSHKRAIAWKLSDIKGIDPEFYTHKILMEEDFKPAWILLLQEFDVIIRDKKGAENLAADHLSRLESPHQSELEKKEIMETFSLETLGMVTFRGDASTSWFADFANYHARNLIVKGMSS
nr:reverse transcriptase domain-containing protein [Tanacetum cinerariifolium]